MSKVVRARTTDKSTARLKLENFGVDRIPLENSVPVEVVSIDFQDNDATRRLVMHSARRVIKQHRDEIQELAYK